mgnify:CR=1 FL=1
MKAWLQSRRFRWVLTLSLALVVLLGIGLFSLPWILIAPAESASADVILHYAIAYNTEIDTYVAQLYREKRGKKIVCLTKAALCDFYPADYARQHLIEMGIPAEDVLTLHLPNYDCLAQALPLFTGMAKDNGWRNALLVIRPTFSRFEGSLTKKYFAKEGLDLSVTYSPEEEQKFTTRWWMDHKTAQLTIDAAVNATLDQLYPECR